MLHGGSDVVRQAVVEVLLKARTPKAAFRFAACGLGYTLVRDPGGVHCSPRGCGHRLCPRCGRKRGGRYARRICGWLGYRAHGDLWSVVLTQRVVKGEGAKVCYSRLAPKVRAWMRWATNRGLAGAMTTTHVVWSKRADGWHIHTHVFVEMEAGSVTRDELWEKWNEVSVGECAKPLDEGWRLVRAAGPMIGALKDDQGDPEFWKESRDDVARSVQYPLRDMSQGVSAWRMGGDPVKVEAACMQMVTELHGAKLFRAWGAWRKACPEALAAEAAERGADEQGGKEDGDAGKAAPGKSGVPLGTVRSVWFRARKGVSWARQAMKDFESSVSNSSEFARRFVLYCRAAWEPGGGGKGL